MAAAALAVGSMAFNAISSIGEGDAEYEAQQFNQRVAGIQAGQIRQQATEEARRQRVQSQKQLGSMKASYGASGVVSSEGSALDVLQESAANAELDNLMIKHQGEMRARSTELEGRFAGMRGDSARSRGYMGAAGALLFGGANLAGKL